MVGDMFSDPAQTLRGTFHARYSVPKDQRPCTSTMHRLLDCLLTWAAEGDPDFLASPRSFEFAVVDVVRKEKAWFEIPAGYTPEMITGMISSSFNATTCQVGKRIWFV